MRTNSHFCFDVIEFLGLNTQAKFGIMQSENHVMTNYFNRIYLLWGVALVFFIVTLVAVYFKISNAPDTIALRYNVIVGVNEVGNRYELFKIPLTGLLIIIANFILARVQKFDKSLLPFLAGLVAVTVNVLLLIAALTLFKVS